MASVLACRRSKIGAVSGHVTQFYVRETRVVRGRCRMINQLSLGRLVVRAHAAVIDERERHREMSEQAAAKHDHRQHSGEGRAPARGEIDRFEIERVFEDPSPRPQVIAARVRMALDVGIPFAPGHSGGDRQRERRRRDVQ
jgi:hypothetical protein